jgi:hypothetical protein
MFSSGEVRVIEAKVERDDYPGSQPLLDLLTENLQEASGERRIARRWNLL